MAHKYTNRLPEGSGRGKKDVKLLTKDKRDTGQLSNGKKLTSVPKTGFSSGTAQACGPQKSYVHFQFPHFPGLCISKRQSMVCDRQAIRKTAKSRELGGVK